MKEVNAALAAVALGLLFALGLAPAAQAQQPLEREGATLTLDEVVRSAERRYPLVLAAAEERAIAEADRLSAEGGFDPTWKTRGAAGFGVYDYRHVESWVEQPTTLWGTTLSAGWRYGAGKFPEYSPRRETNDFGQPFASARIPLWRDGPIDRRRASIERAKLGTRVAEMGIEQQKIEAVRLASLRYWAWAAAGRRLAIAREWLDLALLRDAGLAERVEAGDVPAIEREENARTILQRRAALVASGRALEQATIDLSLFLRSADGRPVLPSAAKLPPELPELFPLNDARIERDLRAALALRPEIRRLEAQRAQAAVERRWAENQRRPAVDLQVLGARDLGPGPRAEPIVEGSILIDVPLATRAATGRVRAAEAEMRRLSEQQRLAKNRVEAEVRDAVSAMDAARARARVAASEVELARRLSELEMARFEAGDSTLLLVNLREQAMAEAGLRSVDAAADYHRAAALYRAAVARAAQL